VNERPKSWFSGLIALSVAVGPLAAVAAPSLSADPQATPKPSEEVAFSADKLDYDRDTDVVTAIGDVRMVRDANHLRADRVVWNRKTGDVTAVGNVLVTNPTGDKAFGDSVTLTDTLKDGAVENMLVVLADGGRLAATRGKRADGFTELDRATFSPCAVLNDDGCPKNPTWQITAGRIIHDPVKKRIRYKNARLEVFGLTIAKLPSFSHPSTRDAQPGLLVPSLQYSRNNGFELGLPIYLPLAKNRDLTLTPHIFSTVLPALEFKYRALTRSGAYQVGGYATYGSRITTGTAGSASERKFRGYLNANGRFQLTPQWSISGAVRVAGDRTFLRRYDISRDDRLRSTFNLERIDDQSYFSVSGWAVQTLRAGESQGQIPVALPLIDYRRRLANPVLGGNVELQLNSLALTRASGQDTQRAFAGARWDMRRLTNMGQELIFTGYVRGDVYHSDENALTTTALYRGNPGWRGRAVAAAAAEVRWPLVGAAFGGIQRLTPRVQIVASPATSNLSIPNEDSRSVDLDDSNLFALNRFSGYDRWEDGARITYGLDWALDRPGLAVSATIGQTYRLTRKATLFPDGTGLASQTSDIVGRTTVKFRKLVSLSHRYRIDKDNFAFRRNEVDATVGSDTTYGVVSYLRLNRNIGPQLEDLRDREEIRVGGRVQLARHWSAFGSTVIDLTGRSEDPLTTSSGFEPVRHRFGIAYEDDCIEIGLTWRRYFDTVGDVRPGSSFQFRVAFRGLGR
jgi:LPS-assembly protein